MYEHFFSDPCGYDHDPTIERVKARLTATPHGKARALVRPAEVNDFQALLARHKATIFEVQACAAFGGSSVIVICPDDDTAQQFEDVWDAYANFSPHRDDVREALAMIEADRRAERSSNVVP